MGIISTIVSLPPALDGESITRSNTALAIVSVISMVFGYLLLAALWYFVFSNRARAKREKVRPK